VAASLGVRRRRRTFLAALPAAALAKIGWVLAPEPAGYGGYQAIKRWPGRYASATEMRKDGVALGY
jgi:hypothetical protein